MIYDIKYILVSKYISFTNRKNVNENSTYHLIKE